MKLFFPWNYLKTSYKKMQLQELKKVTVEKHAFIFFLVETK